MSQRMSRRRFLVTGTAAAFAVPILVACGGATSAPATAPPAPATSNQPTAQPTQAAAANPATGTKTTIRRSFWGSPDQIDVAKQTDKLFMDSNPDIGLEWIAIPWESYRDKLITMIAGGDTPDVMGVDAYWTTAFAQKKMLKQLDDAIKSDKQYSAHGIIKGMWPIPDHHAVDGKNYSAVTAESPRIIMFNATMFKDAGLKTPIEQDAAGTWDWNAYLDAAKKLTKGSGQDKVFGCESYVTTTWNYNFVDSNGGHLLSEDKKQCLLSTPEAIEALKFQADLLLVHKVSPLSDEMKVLGGSIPAFMGKRLAMTVTGIWDGASYRKVTDFEWAAAPLPKSPRTKYRRTNYKPNATSISAISKQPDAAWKYLSFDPIGQNKANIDKSTSMTAFEENRQYFLDKSPVKNAKVVFDHFEAGEITYLPLNPKWFEMDKLINDELTLARNGEKSVADACNALVPKVNDLLKTL